MAGRHASAWLGAHGAFGGLAWASAGAQHQLAARQALQWAAVPGHRRGGRLGRAVPTQIEGAEHACALRFQRFGFLDTLAGQACPARPAQGPGGRACKDYVMDYGSQHAKPPLTTQGACCFFPSPIWPTVGLGGGQRCLAGLGAKFHTFRKLGSGTPSSDGSGWQTTQGRWGGRQGSAATPNTPIQPPLSDRNF